MRLMFAGAALALAAGCASSSHDADLVTTPSTIASPYTGPMHLRVSYDHDASVLERSGAAGNALECKFDPYDGGAGEYNDGLLSARATYEEALTDFLTPTGSGGLPNSGYRVERVDGGRVLLSWAVDERAKVAVILRDDVRDYEDNRGWGVETWAECDPAEFPAPVTDSLGIGVWLDEQGNRVPTATVESFPGDDFCDDSSLRYLQLGSGSSVRYYIRDPSGHFTRYLLRPYDDAASLPAGVADSGFHYDGRELWLPPSHDAVYLVNRDDVSDVELWPAMSERFGCG